MLVVVSFTALICSALPLLGKDSEIKMDGTFMEVLDLKDAGGAKVSGQMIVDGIRINTFFKTPEATAAMIRNLKDITIRDDDVMLCTPPKSGTHWSFQIMTMLLNGTSKLPDIDSIVSMFINTGDELEKLPSPRVLVSHFPFWMLPTQMKEKKTKIILVLRNPKDVAVSWYHYHLGMRLFDYDGKFSDHLKLFMQGNLEYSCWFDYVLEFEKAWDAEPNRIHIVYYEDLKENGVEEITKIGQFLNLPAAKDAELIKAINENCQFQRMKEGKPYKQETATEMFKDPTKFNMFRKGVIGDWKNHFTVADNEAFDRLYDRKMKTSKLKFRFEPSC